MDYVCSYKVDDKNIYSGKEYIMDMPTLYKVIVDKDVGEITIESDFAEDNFTPPYGVSQFIEDVNRINPTVRINVPESMVKSYEKDIELLKAFTDPEDVLFYAMKNKGKFMNILHMLCKQYSEKHVDSLISNNKLASMHLELIDTKTKLAESLNKSEELEGRLYEERHGLETLLARIRYAHEVDINREFLDCIAIDHCNYSKVLYVKEITRVHFVDTLIHYIQEICKTLYNVPARLVVIEPLDAYSIAYQYPQCAPHLSLTKKDVAYGDIFMAGFQQSIMRDVLLNTGRVPYLIILDRSKRREPVVKGDKVEMIYTVSDIEDLEEELEADRVISYDEQTQNIGYIEGFEDMSFRDKVKKYSSMKVVQYIMDLLEKED